MSSESTGPVRGKRPPQGQPVVDRALSLLGAFTDRRRSMTLSELARNAEMPVTTALRLAARLVEWGALERLDDGRYVVGVRLWEIASLSPRGHGVRQIALPFMEDLYEVTRHHVLLAVRDGRDAVLIERLSSRNAPSVAYRVGGRLPLTQTAVGLVLLAAATRRFQDEMVSEPPELEPGMATFTPDELRRQLVDVARTGLAVVHRSAPSATVSVASPVQDADRRTVAALSILVPDGSTSPQAIAPAVRATARAISRTLGYRHEKFDGVHIRPDLEAD
ncbi:IclR family transcriptional regulator [Microbacterium sp. STN6]|uniref:IclR family transcriptional regulator n=1 Tax=Microbacterium sp. STN6 TaxID=2995588 RepID=UPI002260C8C1|nr:IclR family transcriptional regulator [Microbacterium sp. STN6]MCX7520778.1 IclR family transcriptional regulator [Microbacterium sp. STN6]